MISDNKITMYLFKNRKDFEEKFRKNCPETFPVDLYLESYLDSRERYKYRYYTPYHFSKFMEWVVKNIKTLAIPAIDENVEFVNSGTSGGIIIEDGCALKYFFEEDNHSINIVLVKDSAPILKIFDETMNYFVLKTIINECDPTYWANHFIELKSLFAAPVDKRTIQIGIRMEILKKYERISRPLIESLLDFQKIGCTIIHGDAKIDNIMTRDTLLPVFIDFGMVSTQISFEDNEEDIIKFGYYGDTLIKEDSTTDDLVGVDLLLHDGFNSINMDHTYTSPNGDIIDAINIYDDTYDYIINFNKFK